MTTSYTLSETFTLTHAKQIASRVAADLQRFQRFYGSPTDRWIADYEAELIVLLKHDVVSEVVYGFQRNGEWTEATVKYRALPGGTLGASDDPGKIRPNLDIAGAHFTSYLSHNSKWWGLAPDLQQAIEADCPFSRSGAPAPQLEAGYWADDHSYVAGGRGLGRSSARR